MQIKKFSLKNIFVLLGGFLLVGSGIFLCRLFVRASANNYSLSSDSVVLDGSGDKTATINLTTSYPGTYYGIEGNWSTQESSGDTSYLTLSDLSYNSAITLDNNSSNDVVSGKILWFDSNYNGVELSANSPIWTATYVVDKDTPAGTYNVTFYIEAIIGGESGPDADAEGVYLTGSITVTREDPPAKTQITPEIVLSGSSFEYTGNKITPAVTVYTDSSKTTTLTENIDYTVSYQNNTNVGAASVSITSLKESNYTFDQTTKTFPITGYELTRELATYTPTILYTGSALTPEVSIIALGKTLTPGTDYELNYTNQTGSVGETISITVSGKGNYTGEFTLSVAIVQKPNYPTPSFEDLKLTYGQTASFTDSSTGVKASYYSNSDIIYVSSAYSNSENHVTITTSSVGNAIVTVTYPETDDYSATSTSFAVSVAPAILDFSATVSDKTFDGTTAATVNYVNISGIKNNDSFNVGTDYELSAVFTKAEAGEKVAATVILALNSSIENYTFADGGKTKTYQTTATINPTLITFTAEVEDKDYDETNAARIKKIAFSGLVSGFELSSEDYVASAAFSQVEAGKNLEVTVNLSLNNTSTASCYILQSETYKTTATINAIVEPEKPEEPEKLDKPENPEQPEDPEKPTDPEDPEKPENPESPDEPENPEKPSTPEEPSAPETPGQSSGSDAGKTSVTPNTGSSTADGNGSKFILIFTPFVVLAAVFVLRKFLTHRKKVEFNKNSIKFLSILLALATTLFYNPAIPKVSAADSNVEIISSQSSLTSQTLTDGVLSIVADLPHVVLATSDDQTYEKLSATTSDETTYKFQIPPNATKVYIYPKGDVNLNGTVNITDVSYIIRSRLPSTNANYRALSNLESIFADLNNSNTVNIVDASLLQRSRLASANSNYLALSWEATIVEPENPEDPEKPDNPDKPDEPEEPETESWGEKIAARALNLSWPYTKYSVDDSNLFGKYVNNSNTLKSYPKPFTYNAAKDSWSYSYISQSSFYSDNYNVLAPNYALYSSKSLGKANLALSDVITDTGVYSSLITSSSSYKSKVLVAPSTGGFDCIEFVKTVLTSLGIYGNVGSDSSSALLSKLNSGVAGWEKVGSSVVTTGSEYKNSSTLGKLYTDTGNLLEPGDVCVRSSHVFIYLGEMGWPYGDRAEASAPTASTTGYSGGLVMNTFVSDHIYNNGGFSVFRYVGTDN